MRNTNIDENFIKLHHLKNVDHSSESKKNPEWFFQLFFFHYFLTEFLPSCIKQDNSVRENETTL